MNPAMNNLFYIRYFTLGPGLTNLYLLAKYSEVTFSSKDRFKTIES
jgi:hypothetical protein